MFQNVLDEKKEAHELLELREKKILIIRVNSHNFVGL